LCGVDTKNCIADYIHTGAWSEKAIKEASKFCKVNVVASGEASSFGIIPPREEWKLSPNAAYFHYCANETIHGVEFNSIPDVGSVPLVADFSSSFLSQPIDVSKFGIIYAGAQKNCGIAGCTIVIVREDLINRKKGSIPACLDFKLKAENNSLDNTPATFSIYMAGLVVEWLLKQGLEAIEKKNHEKASILYSVIDKSNGFYKCSVDVNFRSKMNIALKIKGGDTNLENKFVTESESKGMHGLKGHKLLGGIRISIYNAITIEGAQQLATFMKEFQDKYQ